MILLFTFANLIFNCFLLGQNNCTSMLSMRKGVKWWLLSKTDSDKHSWGFFLPTRSLIFPQLLSYNYCFHNLHCVSSYLVLETFFSPFCKVKSSHLFRIPRCRCGFFPPDSLLSICLYSQISSPFCLNVLIPFFLKNLSSQLPPASLNFFNIPVSWGQCIWRDTF